VPLTRLRAQIEARWDNLVQRHLPVALPVEAGPRRDFLVVPVKGSDEVRNIPLEPDLAGLIEIFTQPRSLREVSRAMGRSRANPLLKELQRLEVLAPVPTAGLCERADTAIRVSAS
jgi:hypothetical protein